jgi:hypothetical protein
MTFADVAFLAEKPVRTVETFFYRHKLSIKNKNDIRYYLAVVRGGKRVESGKRNAAQLKPYHFQKSTHNHEQIDTPNELLERGFALLLKREKRSDLKLMIATFGEEIMKQRLEQESTAQYEKYRRRQPFILESIAFIRERY